MKVLLAVRRAVGKVLKFIFGFIRGVLTILTVLLILCGVVGYGAYLKFGGQLKDAREEVYDKMSKMDEKTFSMLSDTEVYDKDGNKIGTINAGHYEYTPITDISSYIQNGYIAVEDKRFKSHFGVDIKGTLRAAVSLVKHRGAIHQGGSTIAQQVVKNTMLGQKRTFSRKIEEMLIAPYVDARYGKDKVMEFYCNTNFYGHRCYGVGSASKYYFGKPAKDLSLSEAALLVRISNSPSKYDPVKNPDKALEGRNFVLHEMLASGFITDDECNAAIAEPLAVIQNTTESTNENYQTSYAIHCAALELMKMDGFKFKYTFSDKADYDSYMSEYTSVYSDKSESIRAGGYVISTSLDSAMQGIVQNRLDSNLAKFKDIDQETGKYELQGAAVVVNNETNYVVAIVGGRGTDDQFNRGYLSYRQPGSTIKPLLDYAPAFDTGEFSPSTYVDDHKFEGSPDNAGGHYYGRITVREALNRSLNTVAWQLLQAVGVNKGLSYLGNMRFMGISYIDNGVMATSIGGFTNGLRVVDMAKGYSTLANGGIYSDKTCITGIKFKGEDIFTDNSKSVRVYQADSAYMVTDVLKGTLDKPYGTGYGLGIEGQIAAGKTGTTNSSKDAWFCGYTKYYTTAVFMGYDNPKPMEGVYGATYSGKIWHDVMTDIHSGLPMVDFDRPDTIYEASYDGNGREVSGDTGSRDLFSATAKERAAVARDEAISRKRYEAVKAEVDAYESWFINSAEDAESVENRYREILGKISRISDEELRNELLTRAARHNDALVEKLPEWADTVAEYEKTKAEEQEKIKIAESEKAEESRKSAEKARDIREFNRALAVLTGMQYKDDSAYGKAVADIDSSLKRLTEYPEYNDFAKQYSAAIEAYGKLPTYAEWQEAERKKAEESSIAESERESIAESLSAKAREATRATVSPSETLAPSNTDISNAAVHSNSGRVIVR